MPKSQNRTDQGVLVAFEASLVSGARKPLSLDGDGEGTLQLALSQPEALRVMQAFPRLMDRAFYVVITVKPEGK